MILAANTYSTSFADFSDTRFGMQDTRFSSRPRRSRVEGSGLEGKVMIVRSRMFRWSVFLQDPSRLKTQRNTDRLFWIS